MTFDPGQLRETIDQAVTTFRQGEATLERRGGGRLYTDEEHDERRGRLVGALHGKLAEVQKAVDAELREVDRLVDARGADPLEHLGPADLARASTMAGFIKEDAYSLMPIEIQRRLKALLAVEGSTFDKGVGALWLRYLGQRLAGAEGAKPIASGDDRLMLDDLLGELGRRVAPAAGITPAEARRRQVVAREVRLHAMREVSKADGSDEAMMQKLRASGRYF